MLSRGVKKPSKDRNIAITTLLCFLLCLVVSVTVTGAWFTSTDSFNFKQTEFTFGSLGALEISATEAVWQDVKGNVIDPSVRDYVMPGDKITDANFSVKYDTKNTGSEDVYYVVFCNEAYYCFDENNQLANLTTNAQGETEAGVMAKGTEITVGGATVEVKIGDNTYKLDGLESSKSIPNVAQGQAINLKLSGKDYTVKIMQTTNTTATEAYTLLQEEEDTVKTLSARNITTASISAEEKETITKLVITSSVQSLDTGIFAGMTNLKKIVFNNTSGKITFGSFTFGTSGLSQAVTVYVESSANWQLNEYGTSGNPASDPKVTMIYDYKII